MIPDISDMAIRIRRLNFAGMSTAQIISVFVAAVISVCFSAFLSKKKPEWNGIKNKAMTFAVMVVLMIIVVFLFR